jgi:pentapeptide repeat protein
MGVQQIGMNDQLIDQDHRGGAIVEDAERLRQIAASMIEKSSDPVGVKTAAEVLKLASEIESERTKARTLALQEQKLSFDLNEARHGSKISGWKAYVSLLTPTITTVVLAGTLLLQSYQFVRAEADKKIEAEDARWADAVNRLSQSEKISPAGILLKSFAKSDRYGEQAYNTAIQILIKTNDKEPFKNLFGSVFDPVDWKNLPQVVDLDRTLGSSFERLASKSYDLDKNAKGYSNLSPDERNRAISLEAELALVTNSIGSVLKIPRPAGVKLDLGSTYLIGDLRSADLSSANLYRASLNSLDLNGANLSGITSFEEVRFFSTAWWQASKIGQALLETLIKYYPFDKNAAYGPSGQMLAESDYDTNIKRLRLSASKP